MAMAIYTCRNCGREFFRVLENPFAIALGNLIQCSCGAINTYDNLVSLPDYKLAGLNQISQEYRHWDYCPGIRRVHEAFRRNMDRVVAMPFLLRWMIKAVAEVSELASDEIAKQPESKVGSFADTMLAHRHLPGGSKLLAFIEGSKVDAESLVRWRGTEGVGLAIESMLNSMIVGAWTAFETFATDLWEHAVNCVPERAFTALDAKPDPSDDEDQAAKKRRAALPIPMWMFADPAFNPVSKLGTLMLEHGKWDFSKREHMKEAYRKTFPDLWDDLKPILTSQTLFWLSKLRNAIVHDAGVATADFVNSFAKHPVLSKVSDRRLIPVDGDIVREMVEYATTASKSLLEKINPVVQREWTKSA